MRCVGRATNWFLPVQAAVIIICSLRVAHVLRYGRRTGRVETRWLVGGTRRKVGTSDEWNIEEPHRGGLTQATLPAAVQVESRSLSLCPLVHERDTGHVARMCAPIPLLLSPLRFMSLSIAFPRYCDSGNLRMKFKGGALRRMPNTYCDAQTCASTNPVGA